MGELEGCGHLKRTDDASLQSFALGELTELYFFELYVGQVSMDDDNITTRLRVHKTLNSPLLVRPLLFENSESDCCCLFKTKDFVTLVLLKTNA